MVEKYMNQFYPDAVEKGIRVIRSPLRMCPFGAHIDHQDGIVAGVALDITVDMAYVENDEGYVRVQSLDFPDEDYFHVDNVPAMVKGFWGNYLRGAVLALKRNHIIHKGICGVIQGKGLVGGLSSSAAVTTAYLMALCDANNIELDKLDYIENSYWVETSFIGLKNGILDQSINVLSKKDYLTVMDTRTMKYELIAKPESMKDFEVIIVHSGIQKALIGTDYNTNVDVCKVAAWLMMEDAGIPLGQFEQTMLRDVSYEIYCKHKGCLPGRFQKRAEHYYSESLRVARGAEAWKEGDIEEVGRLMFESGESSINNYNCGCPELITIFNILKATKGVYGARFSGAGYRGCCVGIINPEYRESIREAIADQYTAAHPKYKDSYKVEFARISDGVSKIDLEKFREVTYESDYIRGRLCDKVVSAY